MSISVYDQVAYPSLPYPASHPDRLALIARLFGMQPAGVAGCRVLELGCGAGGNLLPLADTLAGSQFVGIDGSDQQIGVGRETMAAVGLSNVRLEVRDLMDVDAGLGQFDYILCQGVYSWTSDEARGKILSICRENLAPQGVAYVNYNTYPGWHLQGLVRDLIRFHAGKFEDPAQRVQQARAMIDFLLSTLAADNSTYAALLRDELQNAARHADAFLFHAFLNVVNQPCYLHEFVARAAEAGLDYLGDAETTTMWAGNLSPAVQQKLHEISQNTVELEQHLDFLRNTASRRSLLCHAGIPLDRTLRSEALDGLYVAAQLRVEPAAGAAGAPPATQFRAPDGRSLTTSSAAVTTALTALAQAWPRSLPLADLAERVESQAGEAAAGPSWRGDLLNCFAAGLVELRLRRDAATGRIDAQPTAARLARHQAAAGELVVNLKHRAIRLTPADRCLLAKLDGQHDQAALAAALQEAVQRGDLQPAAEQAEIDYAAQVQAGLARLAQLAFLLDEESGVGR